MGRIYLIRHEQPEMHGRFIGRTDSPLSEAGRLGAISKLASLEVPTVYSSPLQRAHQTAAAIACPAPPILLPDLAEIHFGDWEGLTWTEIQERWPETSQSKLIDWFGVTLPGSEPWSEFRTRVSRAVDHVLAGPRPAAIVAHLFVNAVIAELLIGADAKTFRQQYGEILVCELPANSQL